MLDSLSERYALTPVRVFVTDFSRAVSFYQETLGLKLAIRDDEAGWAQFDTGAAQLALECFPSAQGEDESYGVAGRDGEALVGRFVGISLAVPDIDSIHERLLGRGVEFLRAPQLKPWGMKC